MATMATALEALRAEVEGRILALIPNRQVKARATWLRHENEQKPITEMTGRSRLFFVSGAVDTNRTWQLSYTTNHPVCEYDITIVYERTRIWRSAAMDDINQIRDYLQRHPSAVDGVAHAAISRNASAIEITQNPDALWDYYRLPLEAYLEVTPT